MKKPLSLIIIIFNQQYHYYCFTTIAPPDNAIIFYLWKRSLDSVLGSVLGVLECGELQSIVVYYESGFLYRTENELEAPSSSWGITQYTVIAVGREDLLNRSVLRHSVVTVLYSVHCLCTVQCTVLLLCPANIQWYSQSRISASCSITISLQQPTPHPGSCPALNLLRHSDQW